MNGRLLVADIAEEALAYATDHGTRTWRPGREPEVTPNRWDGVDITVGTGEDARVYRLEVMQPGTIRLRVFIPGGIVRQEATFTAGLAHAMLVPWLGEDLR